MDDQKPTPAQMRAARSLLGWSQQQLADSSGVARRTVAAFENGDSGVTGEKIASMVQAIEHAGVAFVGSGQDEGVQRKSRGSTSDE